MKVTRPEEKRSKTKADSIVKMFEAELKKTDDNEDRYHLVIEGEYSRELLDEVEVIYTEAGWRRVRCKTSSENGERPGLTGLLLYRYEL